MTDLSLTVAPKSDQLNADDLIAGPRPLHITKVSANPGSPEQPISVYFDGDDGKPYKPCKSMRRVLLQVWGKDGNAYPGHSMMVYRDPKVRFGGLEVGGIRISHMSHIEKDVTLALTETRASRKPYTVKPMPQDGATLSGPKFPSLEEKDGTIWLKNLAALVTSTDDIATIAEIEAHRSVKQANDKAPAHIKSRIAEIFSDRRKKLEVQREEVTFDQIENDPTLGQSGDIFPGDLPSRAA